jgi:hypothetical protein
MAEKPSDCWALPLRHDHHMAQHDYGDELGWWHAHGIDPFILSLMYFEEYARHADLTCDRKERKQALARKPKRKAKIPQRKNPWPKKQK